MKSKLLKESLNEFIAQSRRMTPETFGKIVDDLIAQGDLDVAIETIKRIFEENPEMHDELGEVPGRDLYLEPYSRFEEWYESQQ